MLFLIFTAELIILFLISRYVTELIYGLFLLIFRHRSMAISLMTLIFFPGTVIHELSHLFTAEALGVHTGKLSLVPENLEEEEIQAGSVQIAKTDPFRRYAIGFAPLIVGLIVLAALSYVFNQKYQNITIITAILIYLMFAVSNSMFSSREDLKGFVGFAIAIGLFVAAGFVAGIRIGITGAAQDLTNRILGALVQSTGLVVAVNVILLLVLKILLEIAGKILHRKFTFS